MRSSILLAFANFVINGNSHEQTKEISIIAHPAAEQGH